MKTIYVITLIGLTVFTINDNHNKDINNWNDLF